MKGLRVLNKKFVTTILILLTVVLCQGCPGSTDTLVTVEIFPVELNTPLNNGIAGSEGYCFSIGDIQGIPYGPNQQQILVGFDDWFKPGTDPLPCNDFRDAIFRGGVRFDLSQFNSIVAANLLFDASDSFSRDASGISLGEMPPVSHGTFLGVATEQFSINMLADNNVPLPPGPNIDLGVTFQVRDWINHTRPNFGFVVWGPSTGVTEDNFPEDNIAQVSFYNNIRLRVIYNSAINPNAPKY
jgi:hypothetical protein